MRNLIVFTIDENYLEPFVVAIKSFTDFHNMDKYEFALVHSNISEKNINKLKKYMNSINVYFNVIKIEDIFKNITVDYHFNSVIFYRLLLPSIFSEKRKLLYLDSDILFTGNIDSLFELDIENNIAAAIPKHNYINIPKYLQNKINKYFASGLLLINVQEYITFKVYEKCLNFLKNEKYEMPDQDALNAVVDRWLELDVKYGVETAFLESDNLELKRIIENPKIIQFSGSSKPWHFRNKHPYKHLYWKYLKMTPFKRYIPEDLTVINVVKMIIPNSIKKFIKGTK